MNLSHRFGLILLVTFFLAEAACQTVAISPNQVPGVSENEVLFGQSAVLSGPSQYLGTSMRLGIETAFHEANQKGGVHGRYLSLTSRDDSYETEYAVHATTHLIEKDRVFALIGAVGTPTSWGALPIAQAAGVPFIAPFTGAEFLRDPSLENVINLRASYYQESERIIEYLTRVCGQITTDGHLAVQFQAENQRCCASAGVNAKPIPATLGYHCPGSVLTKAAVTHQ